MERKRPLRSPFWRVRGPLYVCFWLSETMVKSTMNFYTNRIYAVFALISKIAGKVLHSITLGAYANGKAGAENSISSAASNTAVVYNNHAANTKLPATVPRRSAARDRGQNSEPTQRKENATVMKGKTGKAILSKTV